MQNAHIFNSISVNESHCYNEMKALPPSVIASRIDNPSYMQWDPSCEVSSRFLKCVQFNVQTLTQFSSRKHLLANFLKLHFAIGCFQEARSKCGRMRCLDNVVMVASASLGGNYGCEVWVNLLTPMYLKNGKKVCLNQDGVTKVFSEPRILIVRCKGLRIDFYVVSAHAPYVKSPTNFKDACEWWDHLSKVIRDTCVQGIPILAGIDGNYTVHRDASAGVGDVCRSGEPPPQHSRVCEFLNNSKLLVFNSFSENLQHDCSSGVPSYIPKKGCIFDAICIDHFVGSHNVICKGNSIAQCCEVSHAQTADDHIPIIGQFQFPPACGSSAPIPRKKIRYDRASLGDPVKGNHFINILQKLPVIECGVDNTSHCHILHNNVHSALCEAFPVSKIKRKSFITDATFKHICDASVLKKKRCTLFNVFKNAPLWAAFGV